MTQLHASVAIGTAATLMALALLLLRINIQGRRPVVALVRRWVATDTRTSALVLALISAVAAYSLAQIPAHDPNETNSASTLAASDPSSAADQGAFDALKSYADKFDGNGPSTAAAQATTPDSSALPDVNSMIAKLVARLEKQPDDVKGWKMLGWSYLNTDRPEEAAKAYEAALKLEPGDAEIKKGLEAANAVRTAATGSAIAGTPPIATSPAADNPAGAAGSSDAERDSMIRGMVDRLAARLETSPNDEDGWVRLMRSRMTLGEKDAAKVALTKALAAFANDVAAKDRLTTAAKDLGIGIN